MNKKVNTVLFILAGMLVNILVFFGLLALFLYIGTFLPANAQGVFIIVGFLASIVLSFIIYSRLAALFMKKVDMEAHFHPIFKSKHQRNRLD